MTESLSTTVGWDRASPKLRREGGEAGNTESSGETRLPQEIRMLLLGTGQERPRVQMRPSTDGDDQDKLSPGHRQPTSRSLLPKKGAALETTAWGTTAPSLPGLSRPEGCPAAAPTAPHPPRPPCPTPRTSTPPRSKLTTDISQSGLRWCSGHRLKATWGAWKCQEEGTAQQLTPAAEQFITVWLK